MRTFWSKRKRKWNKSEGRRGKNLDDEREN